MRHLTLSHPTSIDDRTLGLAMALEQAGPAARRSCVALGGPRGAPWPEGGHVRAGDVGSDPAAGPWGDSAFRVRERLALCDPARERERMEEAGVGLILWGDDAYPPLLAASIDPPVALWVRGDPGALHVSGISIVGARRASAYGIAQAARFAEHLSEAGWMVASGAARGVDAQAHRGALRAGGITVAIVGGGLADPYPPEHHRLLESVVEAGGAVVSESPMGAPATPERFPARNRIIAGLTAATLVIEAARDSGAMITARLTVDLAHRDVMALPGPVHSPLSAGCHALIKAGAAALVESPEEVDVRLRQENRMLLAACGMAPPHEGPVS